MAQPNNENNREDLCTLLLRHIKYRMILHLNTNSIYYCVRIPITLTLREILHIKSFLFH